MILQSFVKLAAAFIISVALNSSLVTAGQTRPSAARPSNRVAITFIADQAEAALNILAKRKSNLSITDADWQRLFSSEGYLRLKKRETAMQRPFDDSEFRTFMLSDDLLKRTHELSETLVRWKQADPRRAAQKALSYLPADAQIQAKIYPTIKPRTNSFVFEVDSDPAIFLYLDPEVTREQFENTVAHEFHHIGYARSCPTKATEQATAVLPANKRTVLRWIGAFGEGFAMLAAAGGPEVHPHEFSKSEVRERWDRDVANFNDDLRKVEKFYMDVLLGRLSEEQTRQTAFSFFGEQGPWYTVGWKMAVTIERKYGRKRLIECMCDQRQLLPTYNSAANRSKQPQPALWSSELLQALR